MKNKTRITPENVTSLEANQVFVFGSNLSGIHGAGAARFAMDKLGARYGQGIGPTGRCYAIPSKAKGIRRTLTLTEIKLHVDNFIAFAKRKPSTEFLVTEIGCGLAGYQPKDIAPLFAEAVEVPNIHLPERFWYVLALME